EAGRPLGRSAPRGHQRAETRAAPAHRAPWRPAWTPRPPAGGRPPPATVEGQRGGHCPEAASASVTGRSVRTTAQACTAGRQIAPPCLSGPQTQPPKSSAAERPRALFHAVPGGHSPTLGRHVAPRHLRGRTPAGRPRASVQCPSPRTDNFLHPASLVHSGEAPDHQACPHSIWEGSTPNRTLLGRAFQSSLEFLTRCTRRLPVLSQKTEDLPRLLQRLSPKTSEHHGCSPFFQAIPRQTGTLKHQRRPTSARGRREVKAFQGSGFLMCPQLKDHPDSRGKSS
ncbi:PREDICTED: uncharacterized protein LOC102003026, partial [Chinchilla lanigera]|uniref:uncharacterized protein LOC102003026 n=1 Tax=Chinchilla lanigera TaxID=34839 RepID=UPI0006985449